jgi:hypothetical protein
MSTSPFKPVRIAFAQDRGRLPRARCVARESEAAARRARLTMDQLLAENKRLEVNLKGLKT